jgi:glycosyltransferase involved in cell wall biosynthesis
MNKLKIAHYLASMDMRDGGVVRAVLDLSEALVAAGHAAAVVTLKDNDIPASWARGAPWAGASAPTGVLIGPRKRGGLIGRAAVEEATKILADADVVHIHAMWLPSNEQVASACRAVGTPYVWSPHGMLDDWCMAQSPLRKRAYHTLFARRALEGAAAVHCTAEAELDQAGKWFGNARSRGVVVPLPFDLTDYRDLPGPEAARARFGLRAGEPTLLFLSRLHVKKGVGALIQAAQALRERGRPVRLVIAGGGDAEYERTLREMVERMGLRESVVFAGFVRGREKVSLYQAADAFVLPSSQENFGYVVVEAMAAQTPVITTRGVALWPQLERERAAVLVEPEPEALVAAILGVLDDPAGAREMARRGRAWCEREMDPSRIIAGFVSMYERAAAQRTRAGSSA